MIISALDGTFMRTGFENIINLIPKAEKVKKLAAICKICGQNASFSFRTCLVDDVQLIGGDEAYMPLCRECFNKEQTKQDLEKERIQRKNQEANSGIVERSAANEVEAADTNSDVSSSDNSPLK